MKWPYACIVAGSLSVLATVPPPARAADNAAQPAISEEASAAVQRMGKTLAGDDFSFKVQTIRVYQDDSGQPLHIFHSMKVIAHRPDRLAVHVTGDDGANELLYDGKSVAVIGADQKKYAQIAAAGTIEAMLDDVSAKRGVDFPLADLVAPEPGKAFLSGVTAGREVNTVMIDGVAYRHLFFTQSPGMELELWVDKTDKALPRRLIVTYRQLPGQPNFIAEFFDWQFGTRHPEAEFAFDPPPGATKVDLKVSTGSSGAGDK